MLLGKKLSNSFSFNILNTFKNVKNAIMAPRKHIKSALEPSGKEYSTQTNTTQQAFDEVAQQWQAHITNNPFDVQTFTYFESTQLSNFGTIDNPNVIFTADAPFRFVGCSGPQNQDDYEGHELFWMLLREGPLQRCYVCGQVFKLVRLRNEYSADMDYYMPNFNILHWQDMGESQIPNLLSLYKSNTHYQHSHHEKPINTVYSLVNPDDHDRILTDPAYRMQKKAETQMKASIYALALEDYENQALANSKWRQPLSKRDYENLIESEVVIKKLDRHFRKLTKFHSRKYVDPINHKRRQKRMMQRSQKRWDSSYTIFTQNLTEEQQKYKDYFETDLQNYRQDQVLQEYLDRQELLTNNRYNLSKYDFQQNYTTNPQDDQTSYLQKKMFKFKYRRALDSNQDYQRRNSRMTLAQAQRFRENNYLEEVVSRYVNDPSPKNEDAYFRMMETESVQQYRDYFKSQDNDFDAIILNQNKSKFLLAFQNWQIEKRDRSTFRTIPMKEWNSELGFWANAINIVKEVQKVNTSLEAIESSYGADTLSTQSIEKKQ